MFFRFFCIVHSHLDMFTKYFEEEYSAKYAHFSFKIKTIIFHKEVRCISLFKAILMLMHVLASVPAL